MLFLSKRYGRLGNQLIIASHAIASVIDNGHGLVNQAFFDYAEYFEGTVHNPLCKYPPPSWGLAIPKNVRLRFLRVDLLGKLFSRVPIVSRIYGRESIEIKVPDGQTLNYQAPDIADNLRTRAVFTDGWCLSNLVGTSTHRSQILRYFRPVAKYRQQVEETMAKARAGADIVVGVHIRQDDLRHLPDHWFWLFETSDYVHYMRQMNELLPNKKIRFVVCSDEPQDTKNFEGLSVEFGPGSVIGDLYSLSACDYIIASLSTFARWASYYNGTPLYVIRSKGQTMSLGEFEVADLSYD